MASEDPPPIDPGDETYISSSASAHDLPPEIRFDICHSLNHLPSLLNLAQASPAFIEPATSLVRTLKALDDLPGRAWDRFNAADGLKLLLNLSQQQEVSHLWQSTLESMPARVRRCIFEDQQPAEQQQAADNITSIGSILAAGLAASVCASLLQQLTIDAPVITSEACQLMALLGALQRLELNQLCSTRQQQDQEQQQQQPWRPSHVPQGLLHLQLQGRQGQHIHLDAQPFAAAKGLQSLQLLDLVEAHTIMAFTQLSQLSSLTISWEAGAQVQQEIGTLSTAVHPLHDARLPWYHSFSPSDLPQAERLLVYRFTLDAWPEAPVRSIRHLSVSVSLELALDGVDGCLTQGLPALEVLQVNGIGSGRHGLNGACRALSCHTALHSLRLQCSWHPVPGVDELPWSQQALASISGLTQLHVFHLRAADVPGILPDIAACTALQELYLILQSGAWNNLDEQCRQQLRALQASSSLRLCIIWGMVDA